MDHYACTNTTLKPVERGIDGVVRKLEIFALEFGDHTCLTSDSRLINLPGLVADHGWPISLKTESREIVPL